METVRLSELKHFTDKQKEAEKLTKTNKYLLYGGAMGGGKSYWLRWMMLTFLLRWAKRGHTHVVVGLFCEDYPALKDRHLSKIGREFPSWLGEFHADHKEYGKAFILRPEYGSGVIAFRNLDDASKYQSAEFAAIAVDELTKDEEATFVDLRTRLRWSGIPDVHFIAATNPGGIGHAWVKKKFIEGIHEPNEKEATQFKYIPARVKDNPYLDPAYIDSLSGLPDDKRRAYLEGDWDIFKGQYFSEWRKEIHVVPPFQIPHYYKLFICGDYGYAKPSAIYWCAVDGDGIIYVYRELYETGLTYEMLTRKIISMTPDNEDISYWVMDPAIWSRKGETDLSGAEIMQKTYRDIKKKNVNLLQGDNNRIIGWGLMREYLRQTIIQGKQVPKMQVFSVCTELIRTLPSLVYDEHRVEDVDTDGEDHGPDAVRYGLMSRPKSGIAPPNPLGSMLRISSQSGPYGQQREQPRFD